MTVKHSRGSVTTGDEMSMEMGEFFMIGDKKYVAVAVQRGEVREWQLRTAPPEHLS
jgi:hypothetical protein